MTTTTRETLSSYVVGTPPQQRNHVALHDESHLKTSNHKDFDMKLDLPSSLQRPTDNAKRVSHLDVPYPMNDEADSISSPAETSQRFKSSTSSHDDACPLFMNKLPSNFATNSGLAAIASLLNDDENEADYDNPDAPSTSNNTSSEKSIVAVGGGKVATRRRRDSNRHSPYKKNSKRSESGTVTKSDTTVGEAQLFLSMWKM